MQAFYCFLATCSNSTRVASAFATTQNGTEKQERLGLINFVDDSSGTVSFSLPANQRERLCRQRIQKEMNQVGWNCHLAERLQELAACGFGLPIA